MFSYCYVSGHVEETPAAAWLVELAAAQTKLKQHTAAVNSLKKALQYMALPRLTEEQKEQQRQQQQAVDSASAPAAAPDELQVQRLRIMAQVCWLDCPHLVAGLQCTCCVLLSGIHGAMLQMMQQDLPEQSR